MRREPARTTRTLPKHKQANLFQFKNFGHARHRKRVKRVGEKQRDRAGKGAELGATAICIIAVVMEE